MNISPKCPKCGAIVEVEHKGHLEIFRCPQCQWESAGTFFPAQEVSNIVEPRVVRARLEWLDGRVTARQVLAAKKIVHALDNKPVSMVLQECATSAAYDLGALLEPVARNLQEKAEQLGLKIVIEGE